MTDPADPRHRSDRDPLDRPEAGEPLAPPERSEGVEPAEPAEPVERSEVEPSSEVERSSEVGPPDERAGPPTAEGSTAVPPPTKASEPPVVPRTRAGALWVAVVGSILLLVLLIIFIAQNLATVGVHFLGLYGQISLGLALLIGAVVGAAVTVIVGTARILQLRRTAKRNRDLEPRNR